MSKDFHDLLHQYKREVFETEHNSQSVAQITEHCMEVTEEILEEKFKYHFHKLPDANRAEIINMINNYVREAVLPPVVEKLVHRQLLLEKKMEAMVHLMETLLETLSQEERYAKS